MKSYFYIALNIVALLIYSNQGALYLVSTCESIRASEVVSFKLVLVFPSNFMVNFFAESCPYFLAAFKGRYEIELLSPGTDIN